MKWLAMLLLIGCTMSHPAYANEVYSRIVGAYHFFSKEQYYLHAMECGIIRETMKKDIVFGPVLKRSNVYKEGWWIEVSFDTNKDDQADVSVYWEPIYQEMKQHINYAKYYWFDQDGDQQVDIIFIDQNRNGTCAGISLQWQAKYPGQLPYDLKQPPKLKEQS